MEIRAKPIKRQYLYNQNDKLLTFEMTFSDILL
jgi:hypothetical protein